MIARKKDDKIEIAFEYNPRLISIIKGISGRTYNPVTKCWYIPLTGSEPAIERLSECGFSVDPALMAEVKADAKRAEEAVALSVMNDTEFTSPLPLFPYQKVGAAFLYKIGSGLLGDDVGLGKTIQSLAVAEKAKTEKVLIFCPASVKWQWAGEIEKFIPSDKRTVVIEGSVLQRRKLWNTDARFYIANYELLLRDYSLMTRFWDLIIADEATKISNPQAKQSRAIKKLRATCRIALTGTPVSNRANEIWSIIDFCVPGVMGNYYTFLQRYCLKNQWGGIFGYQNIEELQKKIKRYMIRRQKQDVLPELPLLISTDIPFELSAEEKKVYNNLKKEILFEIKKKDIAKIENPMTIQYTLVKMTRLRQLADSMELLGYNTKSSKLEVLKELLDSGLNNGRKAIVFTQFAEMADILERNLAKYKPLKISGKIKEKYQDVIDRFNAGEENKILIVTSAGQYGLNIQRASMVFHYDCEWSLAKMKQRTGRAHRIGQKDAVLEYNLLAKGTVDYYVKKVLHAKARLSDEILGDTPIGMADIREMLTYE